MVELINNFAIEKNLKIENISTLAPIEYHTRTLDAINEDILLYYSTREGNGNVIKLLQSINMIANDGEDKVIVFYKDDYFYDSLDFFNVRSLNNWFDGIGTDISDYLCQLCYKKYISIDDIDMCNIQSIRKIDNQSINCSECNFKYCSSCIMDIVIPSNKCKNCNMEWKGKLTAVNI